MNGRGRYARRNEHHPLVRWGYHLYQSFRSPQSSYAIRESIVCTRAWFSRPKSTNIFDRDWDLLILLDAARYDELRNSEHAVLEKSPIRTLNSVASCTWQWIPRTFYSAATPDLSDVAYISGNPFTNSMKPDDFALLDNVWEYAWDSEVGTVPPRAVTDRAIQVCRQYSNKRVIVH